MLPAVGRHPQRWRIGWTKAGIRTKILMPLLLLMLLSLLGSTSGFIISTNTTRNSILDRQLQEDAQRIEFAFAKTQRDATESVSKLAHDHELIGALMKERVQSNINRSKDMVDRVVPVRERFGIDQVIVLNASSQPRVNIAPSNLETITVMQPDLLLPCRDVQITLAHYNEALLLMNCAPIIDETTSSAENRLLGSVYTIVDIQEWLKRSRRELELKTELHLATTTLNDETITFSAADLTRDDAHTRLLTLPIEAGQADPTQLQILLLLDTQDINEILQSGLYVTLLGSAMTLLLMLAVGTWLAQGFIRPILKLADVAQAVAAGDLSHRANLTHDDEIGQLGRSLDHATERIAHLLDKEAHAAGERQAILQSIADGVLAVDTEERVVMINTTAAMLLQQDADSLIGRPLIELSTHDNPVLTVGLQQIIAQIRSELSDPDMAPTEEQVSLGERIVRINSTPTLVHDGTRTGAVVVIQDVTRMVESDRAKSDFIATASHEMRTPLTSLKGFVDVFLLSGTDNLSDSQRMFLDTIKRQTDTMVQMMNDLLEMARLEQGRQRIERRWVQPESVIRESVNNLKNLIEQRQVHTEIDLVPDLPSLWIDQLHLRRILTNLISNAVKYVYPGGQIRIYAYEIYVPEQLPSEPHGPPWKHQEERSLVIAVEDNGVGIRETDQSKIFTRFFRSENPLSVEVGGTGLGLAITRSLVEINEGQIGFSSAENEGSCFWIRLPMPCTEPLNSEAAAEQSEPPVSTCAS